jgi:hypothetical protein
MCKFFLNILRLFREGPTQPSQRPKVIPAEGRIEVRRLCQSGRRIVLPEAATMSGHTTGGIVTRRVFVVCP